MRRFLALALWTLYLMIVPGCKKQPATMPAPDAHRASPWQLERGKALYLHYCVFCHGEGRGGDGLNAYNLKVKPRKLDAAFLATKTPEEWVGFISDGGRKRGLSPLMPAWGLTLKRRDIENIVSYLLEAPRLEILTPPHPPA